jgi:hypothetical protein
MFRPIRTLILLLLAFVSGVFFERLNHTDRCLDRGGMVLDDLCFGLVP